ncbi:hypothetical protein HYQ46_000597 [Verticillium longisporum]|nr:hypothetical protein HYQ46_000597 [Verticillium longisporum]
MTSQSTASCNNMAFVTHECRLGVQWLLRTNKNTRTAASDPRKAPPNDLEHRAFIGTLSTLAFPARLHSPGNEQTIVGSTQSRARETEPSEPCLPTTISAFEVHHKFPSRGFATIRTFTPYATGIRRE